MKYLQTGGAQYEDADFFNGLADRVAQQPQEQQQSQQEEQAPQEEEESEYIKNLRAYDSEQSKYEFNSYIDELEQRLNMRFDQLEQTQQEQGWLSSQEGYDYLNDLYDTRTESNPMDENELQQQQLAAESGGDDTAVSSAGAQGAYQFMPQTFEQYKPNHQGASPFNREDAAYANKAYMHDLMSQFKDQRMATAAYNWGPGNVKKVVDQYGAKWEEHLPKETKNYLKKIYSIPTKPGADIQNVNTGLLQLVKGLNSVYPGLVVTSGTDGKHMTNSAHYDGNAVDIGANSSNKESYNNFKRRLPMLKEQFGVHYLDEGDHIHLSVRK